MVDTDQKKNSSLGSPTGEQGAFSPDEQGYYGKFGGAYIPEMLYRNVEELRTKYLEIINEAGFQKEYQQLLQDYVGRPTPLYFAERLSKKYNTKIFLKREDLCHPCNIGRLSFNILFAHIHNAFNALKSTYRGSSYTMLTCTCFSNDSFFAEALRQ